MNSLLKKPRKLIAFLIWTLWIPVILFCAHLLNLGRKGSSFSFLIICTLLLCILLGIRWVAKKLENTKSARHTTIYRIRKQFLYGFLIPLCVFILLSAFFDEIIDDDAIKRVSFVKELSLLGMFFYVANSFYLVIYLDRQYLSTRDKNVEIACYSEKVLVYQRGTYVPINLMEIALIYQLGQINWIITFNEEEHILDLSLKAVQEILDEKYFFKINRSQIVHKDAVEKFSAGSYGKINLTLKIKEITSTVSKDRAKDFRRWFYK
ncbi:LytTR family DNA-binding domain-containing protein [Pedobacter sp. Du54]|uniref:LytR/AlgR family response regulator transcription factor n=1 Tax=Pedobacter anseongensis TaxID=3133439 RepID=UPI0030A8413B